MAYVCHWFLTAEARVQFRSVDVEFVADSANGISCPPTTTAAKLFRIFCLKRTVVFECSHPVVFY